MGRDTKGGEHTMQANRWQSAFAVLIAAMLPLAAFAWDRGEVERFATLPDGATHPEGITADPHGNIYVTTFNPVTGSPGRVVVFDRHGNLLHNVALVGASPALLGLAFHPTTHALLVLDYGAHKVLKVDNLSTGQTSVFVDLGDNAGPNALTFDGLGNVYISDSNRGSVWRTNAAGGGKTEWVQNALLAPTPGNVPPFGANGLAFNKAGNALFVANTANDQIIKIPVSAGGSPGTPEVFADSVNGADGLIIDKHDNLWICANQADEIVVVEPKEARVIAKLGDFNGITKQGRARGLLFPASLVRVGDWIYVTNLAFDLRDFGLAPVDAPWTADVTKFTVSRLKAKIRGFDD
jgi:sugar lactone lactonase YvrE